MESAPQKAVFTPEVLSWSQEFVAKLQGVANANGYYVQLIPLSGDEQMKASCSQEVRANKVLHPTPESGGDLPAVESESETVLPADGG